MLPAYHTSYARLLRDPLTQAELTPVEGGFQAGEVVYPVEGGVARLIPPARRPEIEARSGAYDAAQEAAGHLAPGAYSLRHLPNEALPGWPPGYWEGRAASVEIIWQILEERRRAARRAPVGVLGNAADISDGIGYMGHSLDVGGYVNVSLSQHAGRYGLAASPYTRYPRVQADLTHLPLAKDAFDVAICAGEVVGVDALIPFLNNLLPRLKAGGVLLLSDYPQTEALINTLQELGLTPQTHPVTVNAGWRGLFRRGSYPPVIRATP